MTFPYIAWEIAATPLSTSTTVYRPMVPVAVWGDDTVLTISALIDSGADHTLLPLSFGKEAKVNGNVLDMPFTLLGFGGQKLTVFAAYVDLELTDGRHHFRWAAKVGFVDFARPDDEVAVLGHGEFLKYFQVTFDPVARGVTITPTELFPGTIDGSNGD